jgi:hypothetical protein
MERKREKNQENSSDIHIDICGEIRFSPLGLMYENIFSFDADSWTPRLHNTITSCASCDECIPFIPIPEAI